MVDSAAVEWGRMKTLGTHFLLTGAATSATAADTSAVTYLSHLLISPSLIPLVTCLSHHRPRITFAFPP